MIPGSVVSLLKSRVTAERIQGVQELARLDEPAAVQPLLLHLLNDKSNYVASIAAEALGRSADLAAAREMIDVFLRMSENGIKLDPGCHIRTNLAIAFGRLEYIHADEALRVGIRTVQIEPVGGVPYDTGAHLRANSALAMAQINAPNALRDITLLLFDHGGKQCGSGDKMMNYIEPRKAAARALGRLANPEARVPLTLRLRYPEGESVEVLQECMQALVQLEDPDCRSVLMSLVNCDTPDLAVFAALMMAQARLEGAEQVLRQLVDRYSGSAMRAAILTLASLRTPESARQLTELAEDDRKVVRDAVAEVVY